MPPPPYYGPYPPQNRIPTLVIVLVVLIVVLVVAMPIILYMMTSALITPPGTVTPPMALGVAVTRSADGTNWTLTFASVPSGLNPSTTYLSLNAASGVSLLGATSLSALPGGVVPLTNSAAGLYIQYQGITPAYLSAGDAVHIATTFAGTNASTTGMQVQFTTAGTVLYSGTLQ
jgi:hypothetical protein